MKHFSIIIPCKNEALDIEDCIESILSQNYTRKNYEVMVVDAGSVDGTLEILKRYGKRIKLIDERRYTDNKSLMGPANARNIGAKFATGEILVFMDADVVYSKNYLGVLFKHFSNKQIAAITARTIDFKKSSTFLARCYFAERMATTPQVQLGLHNIRKNVFNTLGGYNCKIGYGEDAELLSRFNKKGFICVYEPKILSMHKEPRTIEEIRSESAWWGKTMSNLILNYPSLGTIKLISMLYRISIPFLFLIALLTNNYYFQLLAFLVILENFFLIYRSLRNTSYLLESFIIPFFKIIRYYLIIFYFITNLTKAKNLGK